MVKYLERRTWTGTSEIWHESLSLPYITICPNPMAKNFFRGYYDNLTKGSYGQFLLGALALKPPFRCLIGEPPTIESMTESWERQTNQIVSIMNDIGFGMFRNNMEPSFNFSLLDQVDNVNYSVSVSDIGPPGRCFTLNLKVPLLQSDDLIYGLKFSKLPEKTSNWNQQCTVCVLL